MVCVCILSLIHISEPTRRTPISSSSAASDVYKRQVAVEEAVRRSGCPDSVHFPGFLQADELARWYAFASCLLYTSPSPRDGLLYPLRRQRQMCIRDRSRWKKLSGGAAVPTQFISPVSSRPMNWRDGMRLHPVSYTHLRAHETDSYILFVGSVRCV